MPVYSFDCEKCEHETEVFTGIASRPTEVECEECGSNAKHRKLNWRPPPKVKNGHALYGAGKSVEEFIKKERLIQYKCATCSHGTWEWFTGKAPQEVECEFESCTGKSARVWKVKLDMHWARFPYYDRGLTPVDGDWDLAGEISKNESKVEEEKETYRDYYDRVHNDPAYKDFRKAQDEGRIDALLPPE